jgi:hypothetical protein
MKTTWAGTPPESWEKRTAIILAGLFAAALAAGTILHHWYPHVLGVPDLPPPRIMPYVSYWMELTIGDVTSLFIAGFVFYHCFKKYGLGMAALFFFGSMIFSGLEENEWILLSGRLLGNDTYFFTRGGLWFLEIPFYTCLGWYFISYSSFEIFEIVGARWPRIIRAAAAGIFAMSLDFFCDPLLVNIGAIMDKPQPYGLWVWQNANTLRLFSIPMMNFVGWALLVFLFTYLFGFILDKKLSRQYSPGKMITVFFLAFPVMLLICYVSLSGLESVFQSVWSNINIFPIDFPLK